MTRLPGTSASESQRVKIYILLPALRCHIQYKRFSISNAYSSSLATPCIPINSVSKTIPHNISTYLYPLYPSIQTHTQTLTPPPPIKKEKNKKKPTKRAPPRNRPHAPLPIPKLRRDRQNPLIPNTHIQQPFVPALDDLALADGEVERRAAIVGGVELGAVGREGAAVVDGDGVAPLGLAGAGVADGVLGCYFGREGEEGEGEEGEEGEAHCCCFCVVGVDLGKEGDAIEVGGGDSGAVLFGRVIGCSVVMKIVRE